MTLYSNRRQPMFEIVEDTVGRHDMLFACCDPIRYEMLGAPGHANCREALAGALATHGVGYDRIPTPINWFMNVAILQRGELDIREPLAEKGDYVILRALKDVVAAVSACPQDLNAANGGNPTDILNRVYRDRPLPPSTATVGAEAAEAPAAAATPDQGTSETVEPTPTEQPAPAPQAPAGAKRTPRPARLEDTAEASVIRIEDVV
jgi:uncharacterized protein YcgI (DUF1989 family)